MVITLTADQIASGLIGFFSLSGVVIYGLKKNGLISFGGGKERRKCAETCDEHKQVSDSIKVLFGKVDGMDKKLDGVAENVQHIAGWIEGSQARGR